MIGAFYETSLAGDATVEIEQSDGLRHPLRAQRWCLGRAGDSSLLARCHGPTLDIGSGPGRLTLALAHRGQPALGIDVAPYAVQLARRAGAAALLRDVFDRVPGTGRWREALLADGNIGIGGDPVALLGRIDQLLAPHGHALVEVEPPGDSTCRKRVRLRRGEQVGPWFPWAQVSADRVGALAAEAGLAVAERWTEGGRWFVALQRC